VRLEVDAAHAHDGAGVLALEGDAGDEAGVDDGDGAEGGERADFEDDGAGGEVGDLGGGEGGGEAGVDGGTVGEGVGVCVGGLGGVRGVDPRLGGWDGGGGGGVVVVGAEVTVGEEDAVFVVAAHAGGVEGEGEGDDGRGGGAFGDEVAGEDEVVRGFVEGEFGEEGCDCVVGRRVGVSAEREMLEGSKGGRSLHSLSQPWMSPTMMRRFRPSLCLLPAGRRLSSSVFSWIISWNFGRSFAPNQPVLELMLSSREALRRICSLILGLSHEHQAIQNATEETRKRHAIRRTRFAHITCRQSKVS